MKKKTRKMGRPTGMDKEKVSRCEVICKAYEKAGGEVTLTSLLKKHNISRNFYYRWEALENKE